MPILPDAEMATTYSFDQLSAKAQAKALDRYRNWNIEDQWWDSVFKDFDEICKCIGVELGRQEHKVNTIYFTGFSWQGDGACFTGTYRPRLDALEKIKEYAPQDTTLHDIASALVGANVAFQMQTPECGSYQFNVRTDSRLCHHSSTMTGEGKFPFREYRAQCTDLHEVVNKQLRALADWLYKQLEDEYDELRSDECLKECLADRHFNEDGVII